MFAVKDWSNALDPSFGLTPDITFVIIKNGDEVNSRRNKMMAHKYFLAMASPVFKEMLFGPNKNTDNIVHIRGTSMEAFTLMIHHIYQKYIDWLDKPVVLMMEMFDLAESYGLDKLMEELQLCLKTN